MKSIPIRPLLVLAAFGLMLFIVFNSTWADSFSATHDVDKKTTPQERLLQHP